MPTDNYQTEIVLTEVSVTYNAKTHTYKTEARIHGDEALLAKWREAVTPAGARRRQTSKSDNVTLADDRENRKVSYTLSRLNGE